MPVKIILGCAMIKTETKKFISNRIIRILLLLTLSSVGSAHAATCTLSVSVGSGGAYDWGTQTQTAWLSQLVSSATSSGANYKLIGSLSHALNVNCPTPTIVTLVFEDNFPSSTPPSGALTANPGAPWVPTPFGVADVYNSNAPMGMFLISQENVLVNGNAVPGTRLRAPNGSTSWVALANGMQGTTRANAITPGYTYAFTPAASQTSPVAISSLNGSLNSETYLSRSYVAGSSSGARFQSSVRITLRTF